MKFRKIIYTLALVATCWTACTQKDAQVAPIGKPIDYVGPAKTIRQLLDSTNCTIYKAAWKKINMDSIISAQVLQAYTLLVPTDAAFNNAGITLDKIASMSVEDVDTLLLFHTLNTWVPAATIKGISGSMSVKSLLTRGDFSDYNSWTTYTYFQYIGVHNNQLMLNGKAHPYKALEGTNGTIYLLDEVQKKAETDMIDYLQSSPDFTFLLEACRINDSIYQQTWGQQGFLKLLTTSTRCSPFTFFAPTNRAFQKAGFNTIDDLRQRALLYEVDWPNYDDKGYYRYTYTSLDTMLLAHHLDYTGAEPANYNMVIFSNDMQDNPSLSNFMITPGRQSGEPPKYIRLNFSKTGNTIMVKEIGSTVGALPLKTTDLVFRNGVMHIIDDGLLHQ
ncbi:MAG: fasciclin domain-containing protein [Chitinophaga sp.]|uniref:fasciclin domain-containing protein n=1 Tax=Chitinophaga sp. TaxID=1869181 RepID=UPI0025C11D8C|nr:fasciclin domain-containing protein [Chitinophaga sp.]MBV8251820.1 fasciclin domain-containing protein [Chitinophaga sp.]